MNGSRAPIGGRSHTQGGETIVKPAGKASRCSFVTARDLDQPFPGRQSRYGDDGAKTDGRFPVTPSLWALTTAKA